MSELDADAENRVLRKLVELPSEPHPCGYLPGRESTSRNFGALRLSSADYRILLDRNFRRAGLLFYRPACSACRECRQMRIAVDGFVATRSQRRAITRNADLTVEAGPLELDDERVEIYRDYVRVRHDGGPQKGTRRELEEFLYSPAVPSIELRFREGSGRLIAVSVLDVGSDYVSSVYHYFDPAESKRSLGVFSILAEIEFARSHGLPWYYLGYLVNGAKTMAYKGAFGPAQWLVDGTWQPVALQDSDSSG